ncbi:phospholipase/carboxylesterase [Dyadobacter jejuensis]|uniref:Phospholipase/carboxylesterase n=1 Tax=Dyadobacter jejuensis TaxID=1082580 RepID=A0A316AAG8_9BACT|nr:dienelactone hydrolase family protein [Dyadobacter jejuensis]PWJ54542.1 phospholipase/carboxylesterase [Dyadobacter jejuensis]
MQTLNDMEWRGAPINQAPKVMIMVHGRGASAESILDLHRYFNDPDLSYVAPQAAGGSWYPYSFMAPMEQNEPGLSTGLNTLAGMVAELKQQYGIGAESIYLLGFSQGACLVLEYAARNAQRYVGVLALSGGLIGPEGTDRNYAGDFGQTPILIGCSDVDSHIPKARVLESGEVLKAMGADTTVQLYKNFGHSVHQNEITYINDLLKVTR